MKTTDNDTHSRLIDLLISIEDCEKKIRTSKRYIKENHLTDEAIKRMEVEIKSLTDASNNLKAEYNRLLATLKSF